jgi:hypothetical protein
MPYSWSPVHHARTVILSTFPWQASYEETDPLVCSLVHIPIINFVLILLETQGLA